MPIVGKGDDVHIEYTMPNEIRGLITKEFMENFREEMYKISNLALDDFYYESQICNGNTAGWVTAFGLACIKSNLDELYRYYQTLEWYDSDIFCSDLGDMFVEYNMVLPEDMDHYICEKLNIGYYDFECCSGCGKRFFVKDMECRVPRNEVEQECGEYYCNKCLEKERGENTNANEYYRVGLKKVEERYRRKSV